MHDAAAPESPIYVTVQEAAGALLVTPAHCRRLCREGKIAGALKFGRSTWMIPAPVHYIDRQPPGNPSGRP